MARQLQSYFWPIWLHPADFGAGQRMYGHPGAVCAQALPERLVYMAGQEGSGRGNTIRLDTLLDQEFGTY